MQKEKGGRGLERDCMDYVSCLMMGQSKFPETHHTGNFNFYPMYYDLFTLLDLPVNFYGTWAGWYKPLNNHLSQQDEDLNEMFDLIPIKVWQQIMIIKAKFFLL